MILHSHSQAERFRPLAAKLLGVDVALLYHDTVFVKEGTSKFNFVKRVPIRLGTAVTALLALCVCFYSVYWQEAYQYKLHIFCGDG
jgi:hypothetical protein